jgi:hypothetical protein
MAPQWALLPVQASLGLAQHQIAAVPLSHQSGPRWRCRLLSASTRARISGPSSELFRQARMPHIAAVGGRRVTLAIGDYQESCGPAHHPACEHPQAHNSSCCGRQRTDVRPSVQTNTGTPTALARHDPQRGVCWLHLGPFLSLHPRLPLQLSSRPGCERLGSSHRRSPDGCVTAAMAGVHTATQRIPLRPKVLGVSTGCQACVSTQLHNPRQARPSAYPRVHSSSSWRHTSGGAPLGACAGQQRCACGRHTGGRSRAAANHLGASPPSLTLFSNLPGGARHPRQLSAAA